MRKTNQALMEAASAAMAPPAVETLGQRRRAGRRGQQRLSVELDAGFLQHEFPARRLLPDEPGERLRRAFPSLIVQALASSAGAFLIERQGVDVTLAALAGFAALNVALVVVLWALCRRPAERA